MGTVGHMDVRIHDVRRGSGILMVFGSMLLQVRYHVLLK